MKVIIETRRTH